MRRFVLSCALAMSLLAVPVGQAAQETYPNRPVRLITPYAPGGSSTIVSRIVGAYLTEMWGQQVIVDNRPGGNTIIGTQMGARANPDGYTLVFQNTTFALNHLLIRRLLTIRSRTSPRSRTSTTTRRYSPSIRRCRRKR